jgi:hypothetical protein
MIIGKKELENKTLKLENTYHSSQSIELTEKELINTLNQENIKQ